MVTQTSRLHIKTQSTFKPPFFHETNSKRLRLQLTALLAHTHPGSVLGLLRFLLAALGPPGDHSVMQNGAQITENP